MSSGDVAAPATAAVIALPLIAVAAAGAAAVLAVRACGAATEAVGRAAMRLGDELERAAGEQDTMHLRARLWQLAATEVAGVNATIRILRQRAERLGIGVSLPKPLAVVGHSVYDIDRLVRRTEQLLIGARRTIDQASAAQEQIRLARSLPAPTSGGLSAAQLLADHQALLEQRTRPQPTATVDADQVRHEVNLALTRLDPDASAAEREQALAAAANVLSQTSVGDTRSFLEALKSIVDEAIRGRAARRREAAVWLDALDNDVIQEEIAATDPRPPFLASLARLRSVVAGDEDVSPQLRAEVADALAWAERAAHRRRLMESVQECLRELQFDVRPGFTINHSPGLRASLPGWQGEHSADVWVDEQGTVHADMLRDRDQVSHESQRCDQLNTKVGALADKLRERGFTSARAATHPGHTPQYRHRGATPGDAPVAVQPTAQAKNPDEK